MSTPIYAHMGLNCKDMALTEAFYCTHFGFRRVRVIPLGEDQIVFLKAGDVYLELFNAKGVSSEPAYANDGPQYPGFRHISFCVEDVDETLKNIGAEVTLGPLVFDDFISGWKSAWIKDPDGRIVEISQGYRDELK
ncbi:MAG: VOC family protein [Desulfuromonadaceae bacterium]|nr:VOC family protein [Desulfuromonadaceae bacterium]MDD2854711.1 VOC family protein [Desulfuromonadaceae bacterium]